MKREVVFFNDFGVSCSEERDKIRLLYNRLWPFDLCNGVLVRLNNYIISFPFNLTTQSKRT